MVPISSFSFSLPIFRLPISEIINKSLGHFSSFLRLALLKILSSALSALLENIQCYTQVPESCCTLTGALHHLQPEDPSCIISPTDANSYISSGCYNKFTTTVNNEIDIVIGVVVLIAATQLLAIIFSFCLCRSVGQERDYHYKY